MSEGLLECEKGYVFNKETKQYIVPLPTVGRTIIVPETLHKSLMKAYCDDMPVEEMSIKFTFPKPLIPLYKNIFGWTRRGIPLTDEDVENHTPIECAERMIEEKKFDVLQEFNKLSWKQTQEAAGKWHDFEYRKFEPFEHALANWKPITLSPLKCSVADKKSDKTFLVVLSDLHYGSASKSCYMFNRPDWNTQKTVECVDKFASDITKEVKSRNYKFNKCVILGLGDLLHSLNGKTTRGTELTYDCIAEEQIDYALESLRVFIERMVELFGCCEVHAVG
jgi:hypothetical protein